MKEVQADLDLDFLIGVHLEVIWINQLSDFKYAAFGSRFIGLPPEATTQIDSLIANWTGQIDE